MANSADDLEAANIQIQTMKADAEEQTEKLSKEMDIVSEQLEIKGGRIKELEAKLEFKSEQEINDEIRKLKSELESGFTSEDEKSAIKKQISSLENTLREYLKLQGGIDSDRNKQERIEQEMEMFHEKADRLREMENKVMEGISRMTLMEHEDWRR
ncbi:golgin subfamily A member 6-like protein 26 [Ptychodera flava]|uniref:golgin subfamily A member 6-like protein 26 n=1 Tax=Ptychodera flava TaxID=63121 RepID=UPI003969C72A